MPPKSKPLTPARLSAISTSLLTSIFELSQQNSLGLPVNPSTNSKIVKNLLTLRDGLIEFGHDDQSEILVGLRNQYERITGLVKGLKGIEAQLEGIDLKLSLDVHPSSTPLASSSQPKLQAEEQLLIDVDDSGSKSISNNQNLSKPFSQNLQSNPSSPLPDISIDMPSRIASRKELEEEEELMRSDNEQVQRIQQVLLDDQDRTLDELSNAISRQRELSLHISSELEVQENLLDELDENMDFTSNRLTRANKRMDNLFQKIAKDGACWTIFGLVAILLFLIVLLK